MRKTTLINVAADGTAKALVACYGRKNHANLCVPGKYSVTGVLEIETEEEYDQGDVENTAGGKEGLD